MDDDRVTGIFSQGEPHEPLPGARVGDWFAAATAGVSRPAMAQACTHDGPEVSCDDGRRGLLSGDAILWPDGTRSSLVPHPSVIIGNKSSVIVGQGVFVDKGNGVVPLDNPSAPNKIRCAVLDGASYCY